MSTALLSKYFPQLTSSQTSQYQLMEQLYKEWNEKINVISRKDTNALFEKHILHSLGIAKYLTFEKGSKVLDVGTGGGFPGIPLAVMFPEVQFYLVDSIGKKIKVVESVAEGLGLKNVQALHTRAEQVNEKFHFIVSRAVTRMPEFLKWIEDKFEPTDFNAIPNGLLYLKGGDLNDELSGIDCEVFQLKNVFSEEFFETKKIVYISKKKCKLYIV